MTGIVKIPDGDEHPSGLTEVMILKKSKQTGMGSGMFRIFIFIQVESTGR